MKGYKGFNDDLTGRGFQYEVGKTYTYDGKIELCKKGFHFCKTLGDVLHYYNFSKGHRFCEVEILGDIIEGENKCVTDKIKIIREIEITVDILSELATNKDWWVRKEVAKHHNIDSKTLKMFAQDKEEWVREAVALNSHTTVEDLKQFAQDKNEYIRLAVARNPNTPLDILKQLVQDEYACVRYAVAKHHNTDSKTLSYLAQDEDVDVRLAVAENYNYVR